MTLDGARAASYVAHSSPCTSSCRRRRVRPGRKVASVAHRPLVRHRRIRYLRVHRRVRARARPSGARRRPRRAACASPTSPVTCPPIFGLGADPDVGLADWLDAGPEAPTEALDRLADRGRPRRRAAARGGRARACPPRCPRPRAGAALAVALAARVVAGRSSTAARRASPRRGRWSRSPTSRSSCCAAATSRCAARCTRPRSTHTAGVVLLDEPGRSLGASEIGEVLDLPVLARVPVQDRDRPRRRRRRLRGPAPRAARRVPRPTSSRRLGRPRPGRAGRGRVSRGRTAVDAVADRRRACSSGGSTGGSSPRASTTRVAGDADGLRRAPRRAAARRAARSSPLARFDALLERAHARGRGSRAARAAARRSDRHRGDGQRPRPRLRRAGRAARAGRARPRRRGDRPPRRAGRRAARAAARPVVADGRRPPPRRLPAPRGDPAARGRRAVRHHPPLRCARGHARRSSASTAPRPRFLRWAVARGLEPAGGRRHERGQDHAAQRAVAVDPARRARRHHRGDRRAAPRAAARGAARGPPAQRRGRGRGHRARAGAGRAAHAPRPPRRRRGARRRGARHAPGAQHRARRFDVAPSTPTAPPTRSRGSRPSCCSPTRAAARRGARPGGVEHRRGRVRRARGAAASGGSRRSPRSTAHGRPARGCCSCDAPRRSLRRDPSRAPTRPPRRRTFDRSPESATRRADPRARGRGATHVRGVGRRGSPRRGRGPGPVARSAIAVAGAGAGAGSGWSRRCATPTSPWTPEEAVEYWAHRRGRGRRWSRAALVAGARDARGARGAGRRARRTGARAAPGASARFAAGLPAALEQVAAELRGGGHGRRRRSNALAAGDGAVAADLRRVHARTQLGLPLADALAGWPAEHDAPGVRAAAGALAVAATMGGRAADAIDGLASSLRHRLDAVAEARRCRRRRACRRSSWARRRSATSRSPRWSIRLRSPRWSAPASGGCAWCVGLGLEALAALWIRRILRSAG